MENGSKGIPPKGRNPEMFGMRHPDYYALSHAEKREGDRVSNREVCGRYGVAASAGVEDSGDTEVGGKAGPVGAPFPPVRGHIVPAPMRIEIPRSGGQAA